MAHDFTAQDAELDALGTLPADLAQRVAEYAGEVPSDLTAVDAMLDALGTAPESPVPAAVRAPVRGRSPRSVAPDATTPQGAAEEGPDNPQSGEIALGEPVEDLADSLQGDAPQSGESVPITGDVSGSFQLPGAAPDDGAADDPAGAMQDALGSQLPDPSTDDVEGEADASASAHPRSEDNLTAAMVSDFEPPEVTQIVPTESRAPAAQPDAHFEIEQAAPAHDPADDEFDALFEGLTTASDAPAPLEDGEGGLVTQSRPIQRVQEEQRIVEAYTPEPLADDFDDGRATEAHSTSGLGQAPQPPAAPLSDSLVEDIDLEELDSGELELVLDEDHSTEDDDDGDPPDDGGDNKPGGLLGRFLGRKK